MKRLTHLLTAATTEELTAPAAGEFVGKLISVVTTLGFYVGALFVVYALFQLFMRFHENEPERVNKVMIFGLSGIALMALGTILGFFFAGTSLEPFLKYSIIF